MLVAEMTEVIATDSAERSRFEASVAPTECISEFWEQLNLVCLTVALLAQSKTASACETVLPAEFDLSDSAQSFEISAIVSTVLIAITVPATNERGPVHTQHVLAAIHQANTKRLPVTLLFARHAGSVGLCCRFPAELEQTIKKQLIARYHDCRIEHLPDDAFAPAEGLRAFAVSLRLRPDIYPIRRHPQFQDAASRGTADPLSGLLAAVGVSGESEIATAIEITLRPARRWRVYSARRMVQRLNGSFFRSHQRLADLFAFCSTSRFRLLRVVTWIVGSFVPTSTPTHDPVSLSPTLLHDREDDLQAAGDKVRRGRHLFETQIRLVAFAPPGARHQAHAKLRDVAAAFAQFNGLATLKRASRPESRLKNGSSTKPGESTGSSLNPMKNANCVGLSR